MTDEQKEALRQKAELKRALKRAKMPDDLKHTVLKHALRAVDIWHEMNRYKVTVL